MKAGGLEKPEQFEAVDALTFRIKLLRKSKLTLPDLAVPVPFILNAKIGKANATEKDPWATEYFHRTPAGSGAYKLERWDPGQQVVYVRNDDWKGGPLPADTPRHRARDPSAGDAARADRARRHPARVRDPGQGRARS